MANEILNAVKRLTREGDKNSVHNQKLVAAANLLAEAIVNALPDDIVGLPGRYRVWRSGPGPACLVMKTGGRFCSFNHKTFNPTDAEFARLFAEDVANGLLRAIRDMLVFHLKNNLAGEKFSKTFSLSHALSISD